MSDDPFWQEWARRSGNGALPEGLSEPDLERAVARHRDVQFSQFLTFAIALAARQYPDELRAALGHLFDISAAEAQARRAAQASADAARAAQEARALLAEVHKDIEEMEGRLDALNLLADLLLRQK